MWLFVLGLFEDPSVRLPSRPKSFRPEINKMEAVLLSFRSTHVSVAFMTDIFLVLGVSLSPYGR